MEANEELWNWLNGWVSLSLPSDAIRRPAMLDPVRIVNRLGGKAGTATVVMSLENLRKAVEDEGLDRPLERPDSVQPSVRDLKLIAWELVVKQ